MAQTHERNCLLDIVGSILNSTEQRHPQRIIPSLSSKDPLILWNDPKSRLKGLGWKPFASAALILVIIIVGLFYIYSGSRPAATRPNTVSPFRYDEVLLDDFQGGLNPNVWNETGYWSASTSGPHPPNGCYRSCQYVWSGTYQWVTTMQMVLNISQDRAFVNYTRLLLNFSLWVDVNPSDTLYVEYYNNGWNLAAQFTGHLSTTAPLNKTLASQWILPQLMMPTTTTLVRFRLSGECCGPSYMGVYLGDLGAYMVGPSSFSKLTVFGRSIQGSLSIPVSIDNGPYYETFTGHGFDDGLSFLISPGNHTLAVPSTISEGATSYTFSSWSDGLTTPSRACNTPSCGSLQLTARFSPTTL